MTFWRRYWAMLRPFKRDIFFALAWVALSILMGLAGPYLNKLIFDLLNEWAMPDKGASSEVILWLKGFMPMTNTMWWLAVLILTARAIVELATSGVDLIQQRAWLKLVLGINRLMPIQVMNHLLKLSIGHHIRERTSRQMTKINRGVNAAGRLSDEVFGRAIPETVTIPVYLVTLFWLYPVVAYLSLGLGLVSAWWSYYDFRTLTPFRQRLEELYQEAGTVSNEALGNIATVQAFGREAHERSRIESAHTKVHDNEWTQWVRISLGGYLRNGLGNASAAFVILLCLWGMEQQTLTLGTMVMLLQINDRFLGACRRLSRQWIDLGRHQESLLHLMDLLDKEPEVISLPTAVRVRQLQGCIEFKQVSFAYNGDGDALHDVSFLVESGQMLAIVGPSGSGKSTIVSLLLRAYDPKGGAILVDGQDLRVLSLEDYRAQLGIVAQRVEIFSISIGQNIAYGRPDATQEEIIAAATLAGAHDFIVRKPDGYNTIVGERGLDLSGGECQRIGIARAILRNPRLLIFDEATASLDVLSERRIQEALQTLRQGRTTIVIAHRFSTIQRADLILVVDEGRIVAQGTRDELREGNALFAQLEHLQSTDTLRA